MAPTASSRPKTPKGRTHSVSIPVARHTPRIASHAGSTTETAVVTGGRRLIALEIGDRASAPSSSSDEHLGHGRRGGDAPRAAGVGQEDRGHRVGQPLLDPVDQTFGDRFDAHAPGDGLEQGSLLGHGGIEHASFGEVDRGDDHRPTATGAELVVDHRLDRARPPVGGHRQERDRAVGPRLDEDPLELLGRHVGRVGHEQRRDRRADQAARPVPEPLLDRGAHRSQGAVVRDHRHEVGDVGEHGVGGQVDDLIGTGERERRIGATSGRRHGPPSACLPRAGGA
jgi:hypothetical protein